MRGQARPRDGDHAATPVLARSGAQTEERQAVEAVLKTCLPDRVSSYLFDGGILRTSSFDLGPLRQLIDANLRDLYRYVEEAFRRGWPAQDAEVVTPEALRQHVDEMVSGMEQVLSRTQPAAPLGDGADPTAQCGA